MTTLCHREIEAFGATGYMGEYSHEWIYGRIERSIMGWQLDFNLRACFMCNTWSVWYNTVFPKEN